MCGVRAGRTWNKYTCVLLSSPQLCTSCPPHMFGNQCMHIFIHPSSISCSSHRSIGDLCEQACPRAAGNGFNACNHQNNGGVCNDGINGDGTCTCSSGWTGEACQYSDTVTCTANGQVQYDGTCICNADRTGQL
jgi:hypothetical protein